MTTKTLKPLSELTTNQRGIIVRLDVDGTLRRRLLDMGLVAGTPVCVKRLAPLGDPIEICLKGYRLALRKSEAVHILVQVDEAFPCGPGRRGRHHRRHGRNHLGRLRRRFGR